MDIASPKYSLDDKVVAVVGCVSGIGLATVEVLLKEKNVKGIALLDFNVTSGENLLKRLTKDYPSKKITFNKCDVTVKADIEKAFDAVWGTFGNVDVLINSAGIFNEKSWRLCIDVNMTGMIESSLQGLARMRRDRGGCGGTILNISSTTAIVCLPFAPIYSATKNAIRSFTTCLGLPLQYETTGVRTLSICPHSTATDIVNKPFDQIFEPPMDSEYHVYKQNFYTMTAEFVAGALLEAYEKAESASVWAIINDKLELIPESRLSLPLAYLNKLD